jgi:23S rRNA (cytidine1920-2'-O)/16S rRNA (cytidine1409-2'-O)-methyltransferase
LSRRRLDQLLVDRGLFGSREQARRAVMAGIVDVDGRRVDKPISPPDTLLDLPLGARYGIALSSTRDSIAYGPTGRGYGASNTTITIRRNGAADTIVVSRLGRVRR